MEITVKIFEKALHLIKNASGQETATAKQYWLIYKLFQMFWDEKLSKYTEWLKMLEKANVTKILLIFYSGRKDSEKIKIKKNEK